MSLPKKCLVDTNVPKTANLATQPASEEDIPNACILACIEAIEHIINNGGLVIDAGDEIFDEYRQQLSMKGQPGIGDSFMKWVHDHRYSEDFTCRVSITQEGESYEEFPVHNGLIDFDKSDRKFVAAANAHPDKPPILQATDSKWWHWQQALAEAGIAVNFLCPDYVKTKCAKKLGT